MADLDDLFGSDEDDEDFQPDEEKGVEIEDAADEGITDDEAEDAAAVAAARNRSPSPSPPPAKAAAPAKPMDARARLMALAAAKKQEVRCRWGSENGQAHCRARLRLACIPPLRISSPCMCLPALPSQLPGRGHRQEEEGQEAQAGEQAGAGRACTPCPRASVPLPSCRVQVRVTL